MIPPTERFDIFPPALTGGCSEGLDAFIFFFKQTFTGTFASDDPDKKYLTTFREFTGGLFLWKVANGGLSQGCNNAYLLIVILTNTCAHVGQLMS